MNGHPRASVFGGILLCSLGVLMQEILLTRIFSFTIWYHFAYLTISTALLGFGAAGSVLAANPKLTQRGPERLAAWGAVGAAVSLLLAMKALGPRPIDPSLLVAEPFTTSLGLFLYFTVVSVPFFCAGIAIATPLTAYPPQANRLYAADLLGAGFGCAAAVAALTWGDGAGAIALCASVFVLSAAFYAPELRAKRALAAAAVAIAVLSPLADRVIDFVPARSKAMGGALENPNYKQMYQQWSPVNRVDVYTTGPQRMNWWNIKGVSKAYRGIRPRTLSIQYDGHNGTSVQEVVDDGSLQMLDTHLLRAPYLFLEAPDVLVIGVGGGIDVQNAVRRGSNSVVGVDLQPITLELHRTLFADWTKLMEHPELELVASEGRHYVRSHDRLFDLVQITAVDTFSAQMAGAYVLAESYLFTVEAFDDYFSRLRDDGILTIVLGDRSYDDERLPPPLASRIALTARAALERLGATQPGAHMMVVAHKGKMLSLESTGYIEALLFKKSPFRADEIARMQEYADVNGFEFRLTPTGGLDKALAKLVHAPPSRLDEVLAEQPFVLQPSTDDKPFFFHVLPWTSLLTGESIHWMFPGSATGQLMLIMMLVQALVLGSVLIFVPLARRKGGRLPRSKTVGYLLYFLSLGLGFLLIEISFVQKYVLILGYPTYSLSVTIFALLVFAALGAFLCRRGWGRPRAFLKGLLACTAIFVAAEVGIMPWVRDALLGTSLPLRIAVTLLLQFPLGVTLGMFFPTGLELIRQREPELIPWAWAINGVASVVATVTAVILGMQIGFSGVALVAVAVYAVGVAGMLSAIPDDQLA